MSHPDFLIIGAMKCGTSTLAAQLGSQTGIFMTTPKEPNFFSDDDIYAQGSDWYAALFSDAALGDLKGEASTHYTKLPTYPNSLDRMARALDAPRLIYLIRNPLDRLVSHYIHEWTMGVIRADIETALETHPELVEYGRYGMQIAPFVERFGPTQVFVTSLEALRAAPAETLARVCTFIGHAGTPHWVEDVERVNVSAERIRRFPMHELLIDHPVARHLRRALVPRALRQRVLRGRQMQTRPHLSDAATSRLKTVFAEDFAALSTLFPDRPDLAAAYPFLSHD